MDRRVAEQGHRREVLGRRVSLVAVEAVARVGRVQVAHVAVAHHLGDDGRRRDRRAARVAVDDAALRDEQVGNPEGVHQDEVGQRERAPGRPRAWRCSVAWWMLMRSISSALDGGDRPAQRARG